MRLRLTVLLACVAGMLLAAAPAQAVIGGQSDPHRDYVGFVRFQFPDPSDPTITRSVVCSAVAVNPTTLVTAGHCAVDGATVKVLFDDVVPRVQPSPFDGPNAVSGTFHAIAGACFFCAPEGQPDLGVITLASAAPISTFATLATSAPPRKTTFTLSGYGASDVKWGSKNRVAFGAGERRSGEIELIPSQSDDRFLKVSSSQVGACDGDSGGFIGIGNVLYAVVSSGNQMCGGNAAAYAVFTEEARTFLEEFGL